jgi:hypothetical protein
VSSSPQPDLRDQILGAAAARPRPAFGTGPQRGIVVCAGGPVMLVNAYVLIRILRDTLHSNLPVELWHMGAAEMPDFLSAKFAAMGCDVRDAFSTATEEDSYRPCDGWQLKSHALASTRFSQVLMLDADQVPVSDPSAVFDWPEMQDSGAVFWPDVVELTDENPVWDLVGLEPRTVRSVESGQICIDRTRHWLAICVADEINRRADTFYSLIYGDKDSFLLAWLMSENSFEMVPHLPYQSEKCLYQRDMQGAPLFQHRTNCKLTLQGQQIFPDGFQHEGACLQFLDDLRQFWNGSIYQPPMRSPAAQRIEEVTIATGPYSLQGPGGDVRDVELLAGHQIGNGRSHELSNWYVSDTDDGFQLVLMDPKKPAMMFSPVASGAWNGTRLIDPAGPASLIPKGLAGAKPPPVSSWLHALIKAAGADMDGLRCALLISCRADQCLLPELKSLAAELASSNPALAGVLNEVSSQLDVPNAHSGGAKYGRAPLEPPFYRRS